MNKPGVQVAEFKSSADFPFELTFVSWDSY